MLALLIGCIFPSEIANRILWIYYDFLAIAIFAEVCIAPCIIWGWLGVIGVTIFIVIPLLFHIIL